MIFAFAHSNKEAGCAIMAIKKVGEKFQPCVIAIHDNFASVFGLELGQPGVLGSQCGGLVALVNVENEINK